MRDGTFRQDELKDLNRDVVTVAIVGEKEVDSVGGRFWLRYQPEEYATQAAWARFPATLLIDPEVGVLDRIYSNVSPKILRDFIRDGAAKLEEATTRLKDIPTMAVGADRRRWLARVYLAAGRSDLVLALMAAASSELETPDLELLARAQVRLARFDDARRTYRKLVSRDEGGSAMEEMLDSKAGPHQNRILWRIQAVACELRARVALTNFGSPGLPYKLRTYNTLVEALEKLRRSGLSVDDEAVVRDHMARALLGASGKAGEGPEGERLRKDSKEHYRWINGHVQVNKRPGARPYAALAKAKAIVVLEVEVTGSAKRTLRSKLEEIVKRQAGTPAAAEASSLLLSIPK